MRLKLTNRGIVRIDGRPIVRSRVAGTPPPALAAAEKADLRAFLLTPSAPLGRREGDGIVTASFGARYWPMTVLAARMIRLAGCKLPFRIYHDGAGQTIADDPLTTVIDIRDCPGFAQRRQKGAWESKTFAMIDSGFRRVMFLDADAYPVADLTPVFDVLDRAAFCFWSDLHAESTVHWQNVGVDGRGTPATQGGHLFVDTVRGWRFLETSDWLSQHSDYYYQYGGYGEQASHEIALACGTTGYHVIGKCRWHPHGSIICDFSGAAVVVHRINKLFADCLPKWDRTLPGEPDAQKLWREIAGAAYFAAAMKPCGCSANRKPGEWRREQLRRQRRAARK